MTNRYLMAQKSTDFAVDTWPSVSSNAHFIDALTEDISGDRGFLYPDTSSQRLKRNKIGGGITYSGDIQIPAYPVEATSLLYYLLGTAATTADDPLSGLNTHKLSMGLVPPNFILGVGKDKKEHRFAACVMKGCTMDYEANELLLLTFDVMARQELAAGSLATVTFPDYNEEERSFAGVDVEHKIDDSSVSYIESASVEITNNITEDNFVLGSRTLPNKYVQGFEVTGSLSIAYADYARYKTYLDEDSLAVDLIAKYGDVTTTKYRELKTELPSIALNTGKLPTDGSDRYILELEYMAERDSSDHAIYMYAVNDKTNVETVA